MKGGRLQGEDTLWSGMMSLLRLSTIQDRLAGHQPRILPVDRRHAAVAMVFREEKGSPQLLFIRRAQRAGDPWSGDIAFPGGRRDSEQEHPRKAAERETLEELGLDLDRAEYFGRLDDLCGATLPVLVSCFAYHLPDTHPLQLNHEVAAAFWFDLVGLLDPQRHHLACFHDNGRRITHPAVDLLGREQAVLWGITYRLVRSFYQLFDIPFGSEPVLVDARP